MRGHFPRRHAGRGEKRKQASCCTSAHYNGVKHHWLVCRENTKKMFQSSNCVLSAESLDWMSAQHCTVTVSGSPPPLGPASAVACGCWRCWVDPKGQQELHLHPALLGRRGLRLEQHLGQTWGRGTEGGGVDGSNDITLTKQQFHVRSDAIVRGVGEMCRSGRMSECANCSGELILQINGVGFKVREEASRGSSCSWISLMNLLRLKRKPL